MSDFAKIFTIIAIILVAVVGTPILTILAINTLFGTAIEITALNWLATFWLMAMAHGSVKYVKK